MRRVWFIAAAVATPFFARADDLRPFHFAHEISPLLVKQGCASAECHGAATGQAGFKLSLFAMDPAADYAALTQDLDGRRIDLARPEASLLLRKPTRQLKHEGGRIFKNGSADHEALLGWIRRGALFTADKPGRLARLRLEPRDGGFAAVAEFRLTKRLAKRDVTRLTVFSSTDESVALVHEDGSVTRRAPGEAWIIARYAGHNARAIVRQSFNEDPPDEAPPAHPLDDAWLAGLESLGLRPGAEADATVLARRLHIDLAGRPPSPDELDAFLALPPAKRLAKTADRLMRSEAFPQVFAGHYRRWLELPEARGEKDFEKPQNTKLLRHLLKAVRQNKPLPQLARDILGNGEAGEFVSRHNDPRDRAEYVGRTLLGLSLGCARCHDHPMDRWKQREHLAFSAHFADARPNPEGGMMAGKLFLPGTGKPVQPALLRLGPAAPLPGDALAWSILDGGHDQFGRNVANRFFGILVGKHLVDAPDDHRLSNPAIHGALLDALVREFGRTGGDPRILIRTIVTSRVYALASEPREGRSLVTDPAARYLARREARPLTPAQFKRAVESVIGDALPHEPPPESPLARQLYVLNSGLIQDGLAKPGNAVAAIGDFVAEPASQLRELFRLVLSRDPKPSEAKAFLPTLEKQGANGLGDLAFALMAGREFGSLR
ncbi:MAG: DUF1549 domain-containing protein [Verrucomicrobiota bacterium]|nr:DUF1549 domain-containing protein [Verrucomicrobiota bacterium]